MGTATDRIICTQASTAWHPTESMSAHRASPIATNLCLPVTGVSVVLRRMCGSGQHVSPCAKCGHPSVGRRDSLRLWGRHWRGRHTCIPPWKCPTVSCCAVCFRIKGGWDPFGGPLSPERDWVTVKCSEGASGGRLCFSMAHRGQRVKNKPVPAQRPHDLVWFTWCLKRRRHVHLAH